MVGDASRPQALVHPRASASRAHNTHIMSRTHGHATTMHRSTNYRAYGHTSHTPTSPRRTDRVQTEAHPAYSATHDVTAHTTAVAKPVHVHIPVPIPFTSVHHGHVAYTGVVHNHELHTITHCHSIVAGSLTKVEAVVW